MDSITYIASILMFKSFSFTVRSKHFRLAAYVLGAVLVLLSIAFIVMFQKRESLLKQAIAKAQANLKEEQGLLLEIEKARFSGLKTVLLSHVSIVPPQKDTLLKAEKFEVSVKLWPLIRGEVQVSDLGVEKVLLQLVKKDSTSNYDFLFARRGEELRGSEGEANLAALAHRFINSVLYKIPDNMQMQHFECTYNDDSISQRIVVPTAIIDDGDLKSTILLNDGEATWHVTGKLDPSNNQLSFKLFAEGKPLELPLLKKKYGLSLRFDTLEAALGKLEWEGNTRLQVIGQGGFKNLVLRHWRIGDEAITIEDASIDAVISVGKNHVTLERKSQIALRKIKANPYAKVVFSDDKQIELGLNMPEQSAQDFFDALPHGLFDNLEGLRVAGKLKYDFGFYIDLASPDSVMLHSSLDKKEFKINSWGKTNLSKINAPFVYTPYENGKPMRDIIVGPENPNFTPLDAISPHLRNAILTAEDPSFFSHRGFVTEAITSSISTNIKAKSFKRGGSTISMQLVKNVFLGREKTLARKVEEMLMVWIIENNRVSSKQRMYEVYLNIIEWGRNVYGIGEASRFYFGKSPAELNLGESIYLASIVPKPKTGLYPFQYTGELKPYMGAYYRLIGGLMARRGLAPYDSSSTYGFYDVSLRQPLRPAMPAHLEPDSLGLDDSIYTDTEIKEKRSLFQRLFGRDKNEEKNEDQE